MPPMRYEIAAPEVEEWAVVEAGDNDWGPAGGVNKKADATFIANAPTDIASLLAALAAEKAAREQALAERDRLREALIACIKVLHGCDYATQRVPLGVSGAIHKAAVALATTPAEHVEPT